MPQTQSDQSIDGLLSTLRDVEGVLGSFLVSEQGELLGQDMPRYVDAGMLEEVGPRAARIFDTLSCDGPGAECVIRYHGHRLYLRTTGVALLVALLKPEAHMPTLRTAATLVGRRMDAL